MPDKNLRILIADDQSALCSEIERHIKSLGYWRIATVQSFRELLRMTHFSYEPFENFDILIINAELAWAAGIDLPAFCQGNPQIRHALIHDHCQPSARPQILCATPEQKIVQVRSPNGEILRRFMSVVDPEPVTQNPARCRSQACWR